MKIGIYLLAALLVVGLASANVCIDNKVGDSLVAQYTCADSMFAAVGIPTAHVSPQITGTCDLAEWTTQESLVGLVVFDGQENNIFSGGKEGNISSWNTNTMKDIYFCTQSSGGAEVSSFVADDNGVPEFSTLTLGIAVLTATMGLVYLRKR